jgi:cob(I)alamin adenosyltransferase
LRDSAGLSPDFAPTVQPARYTVARAAPQTRRVAGLMDADANTDGRAESSPGSTTEALTDDPRPDGLRSAPSLVLVNTGNGKGKSSAAFGVMLRALASTGRSPCASSSSRATGRSARRRWAASSASTGTPSATASPGTPTISSRTRRTPDGWAQAKALIEAGDHQLVILDEVTYLCSWGWIDVDDIVRPSAAARTTSTSSSPAATRRQALVDVADTVTEMTEVKHAYQQGIRAKRGIDY